MAKTKRMPLLKNKVGDAEKTSQCPPPISRDRIAIEFEIINPTEGAILTQEELAQLPQCPLGGFWTLLNHPEAWVDKLTREDEAWVESRISGTQE